MICPQSYAFEYFFILNTVFTIDIAQTFLKSNNISCQETIAKNHRVYVSLKTWFAWPGPIEWISRIGR